MKCSSTTKYACCCGLGVFLGAFGFIFVILWPSLFEKILNDQLTLSPGSASYDLWKEIPIPMYIEFYFFNWTNANDLKGSKSKPVLQELGPYVFREHRVKVVSAWNDHNSTVTFRQNRTWHFEPSLSKGNLDDVVTTINIPAITAAFAIRNEPSFVKSMLNAAMRLFGTRLVVRKKVREFLFEGYTDPLLDLASIIPPEFIPVSIPFDKFGWFYTRNGSADYDGTFNMYTGKSDMNVFGEAAEWNFYRSTPFYKSYCAMVNGSAGEFFPPDRDKGKISLFSPDICRTLDLNFKEETEFMGISGYRYWGDDNMFDNYTSRADNWCFCPSGKCAPNGAIDVSSCKWGAPAFISFPHFFHGDPWYRESVVGMKPDESKHQMFIDIEPRSGIPLQVAAAMQINILLQPMSEYSILHGVPTIYFPAIWFKQTAHIDDDISSQLKIITRVPLIGNIVSLVILSIGLSTLIVLSVVYATQRCRRDEDRVILVSQ